jgi:hypothetical protein
MFIAHVDFPDMSFGCLPKGCEYFIDLLLLSEQLLTDSSCTLSSRSDLTLQKVDEELVENLPFCKSLIIVDTYLGILIQYFEHNAFVIGEFGDLLGEISLFDLLQVIIDLLVFHVVNIRYIKEIKEVCNIRWIAFSGVSWKVGRFYHISFCRTRCAFEGGCNIVQTNFVRVSNGLYQIC